MKFIRIFHESEGGIEKSVPRVTNCRVVTNGDPWGRIFYPILTRLMEYAEMLHDMMKSL